MPSFEGMVKNVVDNACIIFQLCMFWGSTPRILILSISEQRLVGDLLLPASLEAKPQNGASADIHPCMLKR